MRKILRLALIPLSLILSSQTLTGMSGRPIQIERKPSGQNVPTGCAYNVAVLDGLAQKTEADELIIVVARLGKGERGKNLVHRRLHNVRTYLTEFLTDSKVKRKRETIILAEGERADGYARLEFYVRGKLFDMLLIRRDADLSIGNCAREPPEKPCPLEERNFYPCLDKYTKPRRAA